jgi:hypothetical protein
MLMFTMDQAALDPAVRLASAIAFKNFVKCNWDSESGTPVISDHDRTEVKANGTSFCATCPQPASTSMKPAQLTPGSH